MLIYQRIFGGQKGTGGFTILELLAVFAILAIIAALAVPRYTTVVRESKVKACKSNVEMITKAAEMYQEVEGNWPSMQDLVNKEYIDDNVYCPVASEESEDTAYEIEDGVVECLNADNHDQ